MSERVKAAAPKKIAISAGVIAGNKLYGMTPQYPEITKVQRIQGTVAVDIVFSATGAAMDVTLASGNAELGKAVVEALKTWRIRPISCNDSPAFQRRHISVRSAAETSTRFPRAINTTSCETSHSDGVASTY